MDKCNHCHKFGKCKICISCWDKICIECLEMDPNSKKTFFDDYISKNWYYCTKPLCEYCEYESKKDIFYCKKCINLS